MRKWRFQANHVKFFHLKILDEMNYSQAASDVKAVGVLEDYGY